MTALPFATAPLHAAPRHAVLARAVNAVAVSWRAWKNRRAFYHLGQMSDAELSDIGLTRADLHVAVTGMRGEDPTARLRAIVQARSESEFEA